MWNMKATYNTAGPAYHTCTGTGVLNTMNEISLQFSFGAVIKGPLCSVNNWEI